MKSTIKNDNLQPIEPSGGFIFMTLVLANAIFSLGSYVKCSQEALILLSLSMCSFQIDLLDLLFAPSPLAPTFVAEVNTRVEPMTSLASLLDRLFLFVIKTYTNTNTLNSKVMTPIVLKRHVLRPITPGRQEKRFYGLHEA